METAINENGLWKRFSEHLREVQALITELEQLDLRRVEISGQIAAKKKFIEDISGYSFSEAQEALVATSQNEGKKTPKPKSKGTIKPNSLVMWTLRAIADYEDHNPTSRINERSIRIFIDYNAPGFLSDYNANSVFAALNELCERELIVKIGKVGKNQSQFRSTSKGRSILEATTSQVTEGS